MSDTYTVGTDKTYATIGGANTAIGADVSGVGFQDVEIYAGGVSNAYAESISWRKSNESETDRVRVYGMIDHAGVPGAGIMVTGSGANLYVFEYGAYTVFDMLELKDHSASGSQYGTRYGVAGTDLYVGITNLIVHGITSSNSHASAILIGEEGVASNCIAYNITAAGSGHMRTISTRWTNSAAYFCTIFGTGSGGGNLQTGLNMWDGGIASNIYAGPITGSSAKDFRFNGGSYTINYCCSEDPTANDGGGIGHLTQKAATDQFNNAGSYDFSLKDTADIKWTGVAVDGITLDIAGLTRPDPPSMGAFDLAVPAADGEKLIGIGSTNYIGSPLATSGGGSVFVKKKLEMRLSNQRMKRAA